jgi:3-hydroxyisobutyrate dehydrogenase-like beta-hydroxyacid dehydrogenase
VGLGRTGQLKCAILSKETGHQLVATNRTPRPCEGTASDRSVTVPWDDLSMYESADAVGVLLVKYDGYPSLGEQATPLVIDMSSPSITRQLDPRLARVLHLDQLAEGERQLGVTPTGDQQGQASRH